MNLIEIDDVDLETPEARFALTPDRIPLQTLADLAFVIPDARALREDIGPVRASFDRARHDFLRMSKPINGSSVNPIDAAIESRVNRVDGLVIILRAPGESPSASAHRP